MNDDTSPVMGTAIDFHCKKPVSTSSKASKIMLQDTEGVFRSHRSGQQQNMSPQGLRRMSDYIPTSTYEHQNGSAVQFRHFGWNSYRCIFNIKSENVAKRVVAETGCEVCGRHRDFF